MKVIIVGGGILGLAHAWTALKRGHQVVQLEREHGTRGASVRNFGLIWVSGRATGGDFELARHSRELWQAVAAEVPDVGFRANGSLTVLRTAEELAVAEKTCAAADAHERDFHLLDAAATRAKNPALRGTFLGSVYCGLDAAVESRRVPQALRDSMQATGNYQWLPGREVREYTEGPAVIDHTGQQHDADLVVLCTGANHTGLAGAHLSEAPLRRVRLQMMQTAPLDQELTTSVADGDSMRYYPAWDRGAVAGLPAQSQLASEAAMQLLMVQRLDGSLTIGDTHAYDEPFDFDVHEDYYDHLRDIAQEMLGRELPAIQRRWAGVYSQYTDDDALYHRAEPAPGVVVVNGPGGRGMTCSMAIAEQTYAL